jgi:phosphoribosylglycinamide formyltransferase 1
MKQVKVAIFASGNGSNAENIFQYFSNHNSIYVDLLITNKEKAPVIEKAKKAGIECLYFSNEAFAAGNTVLQELDYREIEWVVLAGFLRKIPINMIRKYEHRMVNVHPSLLPAHGGEGMYGMHVHRAVLNSKDKESGITIHFVNEEFDKGEIIAQFSASLAGVETAEEIAKKIHLLEMIHFPKTIEQLILKSETK